MLLQNGRRSGAFPTKPLLAAALFLSLFLLTFSRTASDALQQRSWTTVHAMKHKTSPVDIKNRTLGFEKIFVLSLPERMDKRDVTSLAALYTDIDIEFVDGVKGEDVPLKSIPPGWKTERLGLSGTLGSFRSHLNILQRIIREEIQSALILEDDADWDIMLKSQLVEFSRGTRSLQGDSKINPLSPYGDNWDLLLLGHCGVKNRVEEDANYYVIHDDPTVTPPVCRHPPTRTRVPDMSPPELQGNFTRIILDVGFSLCSVAYGLSLKGAEKLLYQFSARNQVLSEYDRLISRLCHDHLNGAICYAPYPALFEQYHPPGNSSRDSDRKEIDEFEFVRVHGETRNIVFPVKSNLEVLVDVHHQSIGSQWPNETLLSDIDPEKAQLPEGQLFFMRKDQWHAPPGYWGG